MTISAPLISRSTVPNVPHRFLRVLVRRPARLVLMALYVFATSCATSVLGVFVGLAVVAVFALKTICMVRVELRLTG